LEPTITGMIQGCQPQGGFADPRLALHHQGRWHTACRFQEFGD
jgi:hypothetical protein